MKLTVYPGRMPPSYALTITQTLGGRPVARMFCTTPVPTARRIVQCGYERVVEPEPLEDLGAAIARVVRVWLDEHARPSHLAPHRKGAPLA